MIQMQLQVTVTSLTSWFYSDEHCIILTSYINFNQVSEMKLWLLGQPFPQSKFCMGNGDCKTTDPVICVPLPWKLRRC
jgi:hypothetical protein